MTRPRRLTLGVDRFSGFYIWALFIVVFGVWRPQLFLTASTAHSIASQQSISALLAIAVLVPLLAGAYDLSVGATINLTAVTVTWLQTTYHWGMWEAIALSVATAVVIGVINGAIVVLLRVNSFIATLGMGSIITAVQAIVSGSAQPLPPTAPAWSSLTQRQVFGFQIVFLYLIVVAVIMWWVLDRTPAGRYMYAIGGNAEAARLAGIRVGKWTWISLIVSSAISGIAGVFYSSLNGPSLTFGPALLLPAFAAVFLGSTQLRPGRYNIWGTLLAVFVLATGVAGLELVTGVQWLNDMFNGVAVIAAVAFAVSRRRSRSAKPADVVMPPEDTGIPPVPEVAPPPEAAVETKP
jgi:ribose transport system permease protein